ncbi:MAG: hypothetical protein SCH98_16830 [Deferrisomatales bacterium]|nr:hypothetical protein [Deferrisomatales bacterium]
MNTHRPLRDDQSQEPEAAANAVDGRAFWGRFQGTPGSAWADPGGEERSL